MGGAVQPGGFVLIASPDLRDYRTSFWESDAGHVDGGLIPTHPIDALTRHYVGRPLATGVKIATLWGLAFVGQAGAEPG
jgi:hypothetical protein